MNFNPCPDHFSPMLGAYPKFLHQWEFHKFPTASPYSKYTCIPFTLDWLWTSDKTSSDIWSTVRRMVLNFDYFLQLSSNLDWTYSRPATFCGITLSAICRFPITYHSMAQFRKESRCQQKGSCYSLESLKELVEWKSSTSWRTPIGQNFCQP